MSCCDARRTFLKGLGACAVFAVAGAQSVPVAAKGLPDGKAPAAYARERFLRHWNCAQAVVEAFSPRFNQPLETAVATATPFAGGMCCGSTCGALTGGLLVIGLTHGAEGVPSSAVASRAAALRRDFVSRFKVAECSGLMGTDMATKAGVEAAAAKGMFTSKCPLLVEAVAAKMGEIL
jgi:C_GCAxxG_C_C family probable redox protein